MNMATKAIKRRTMQGVPCIPTDFWRREAYVGADGLRGTEAGGIG